MVALNADRKLMNKEPDHLTLTCAQTFMTMGDVCTQPLMQT